MKQLFLTTAMAALMVSPVQAACYADYKAKRDNPLRLHYGVIALDDAACNNRAAAAPYIADKISADGWKLLNVVSLFGDDGLSEREASAGEFYLRY